MFTFNRNTTIKTGIASVPVRNAISLFERDRDKVFAETKKPGGSVVLVKKNMVHSIPEPEAAQAQCIREHYQDEERYTINVSEDKIVIYAQGDLGFVYGLFYLSGEYMEIHPFWFWMDQTIEPKKKVMIPEGVICSKEPSVLFRGWYSSDATLLSKWKYNENDADGWNMYLEALLRCGGNVMVTEGEECWENVAECAKQYGLYYTAMQEKPSFAPEIPDTVFCYNLQATNHVTMFPESIDFVNEELNATLEAGKNWFWAVQGSNLRPHIYFLDAVRKKWQGAELTGQSQAEEFVGEYFPESDSKEEIEALYMEYPEVMVRLNEGATALGELFYTENVRLFCHQLLVNRNNPVMGLCKIDELYSMTSQIQSFGEICRQKKEELEKLCLACTVTEHALQQKTLLSSTIGLHIKLHQTCRRAARVFARGYESFLEGDYERAFLRFGDSAVWFDKGDALLRGAEYGVWKDFYANDCITDIKHTAYMVRKVMGYVRELGDSPKHDAWYLKYCLSPEEQEVKRNHIPENHKTDFELYEAMKKRVVR